MEKEEKERMEKIEKERNQQREKLKMLEQQQLMETPSKNNDNWDNDEKMEVESNIIDINYDENDDSFDFSIPYYLTKEYVNKEIIPKIKNFN